MKRKGSIFGCLFLALFLIMAVPALADDQRMLEDEMREANQRIIDFMLKNNTVHVDYVKIEAAEELMNAMSLSRSFDTPDAMRMDIEPYKIHEGIILDGYPSHILIYPDGSFGVLIIKDYTINDDGTRTLLEAASSEIAVLSNGTLFFRQTFSGTGRQSREIQYRTLGVNLGLTTVFNVTPATHSITYIDCFATGFIMGGILNSATSRLVGQATGVRVFVRGDYNFNLAGIFGGTQSVINKEIAIDEFNGWPGFTIIGRISGFLGL